MADTAATSTTRRPGVLGVHSLDRFVFTVPELDAAERFYQAFGLDVRRSAQRLDLHTVGHPQRWGSVFAAGASKKLQYLSFGIFAEDVPAFRERIQQLGLGCEPHPLADREGLWLRSPDGVPLQLVVAAKSSPSQKSVPTVPRRRWRPAPAQRRAAAGCSRCGRAACRTCCCSPPTCCAWWASAATCSACACRTTRATASRSCTARTAATTTWWRSPSRTRPACTTRAGTSAASTRSASAREQMRTAGYTRGWGVGRHVLGSNYFYYVKDPWGSFAEYSFDIDFVPHDLDWPAADHPPEDSFYVWGPPPLEEFIENHEVPA